MKKFQKFPGMVNDYWDNGLDLWWPIYPWLKHIDPNKVAIYIDSFFPFKEFPPNIKAVVCTCYEVWPRIENLEALANSRPDLPFIWLSDVDCYDYVLPKNVYHIRYRHFQLRMLRFRMNYDVNLVPRVKDKNYNIKFSSMSFWPRQARALITAALLKYAKDQSFISWHGTEVSIPTTEETIQKGITTSFDYSFNWGLVKSLQQDSRFSNLDWSFLHNDLTFDDFNLFNNYHEVTATDINHAGYQNSVINFTNETTSFGLYDDGSQRFIRPGPYLNEKTAKPLLTGTIAINSGQPFLYKYLKELYEIDCDYKLIDLKFDSTAGDLDRFEKLVTLIRTLSDIPLKTLLDANIDTMARIQDQILDPAWYDHMQYLNQKEDAAIAELLGKFV